MDILLNELTAGIPATDELVRIVFRLVGAALLGAIVGAERERTGKAAGLRTHMIVSVSCALLIIAPHEAGMTPADVSRVIQGVAAGIGFLGAGAILKLTAEREIQGLTTAASIWMTATVGVAAGLGQLGLAAFSVALAWVILAIVSRLEPKHPS